MVVVQKAYWGLLFYEQLGQNISNLEITVLFKRTIRVSSDPKEEIEP